jgi:hypothetical protein
MAIIVTIGDRSYLPIKNGTQTGIQLPKRRIEEENIQPGSEIEFHYVEDLEIYKPLHATVTGVELWDDGYWYMVYFSLN